MMHQAAPSSTVVVLEDANTGAPFRELDHTHLGYASRVRVVMPFDTEYKFRFKFLNDLARRRLELSIDGTVVAKDLILTGGSILERFLDSAKRFKFVKATASGVADPSSPNNGLITVKLWREKDPYQDIARVLRSMMGSARDTNPWGGTVKGVKATMGASYCADKSLDDSIMYCSTDGVSHEAGATVEGAASNQRFGTTQWNGDEDPTPQVFEFQLVGRAEQTVPGVYCSQCGACHVTAQARFCAACGARR